MSAAVVIRRVLFLLMMLGCVGIIACEQDVLVPDPDPEPTAIIDGLARDFLRVAPDRSLEMHGSSAPTGVVGVSVGANTLNLWPWTGSDLDGSRVDPVNVIFVGHADPLRIRAALMELDGDRTAMNFPDVYPFNATWSDAIGDVQTNWTEGVGWTGSVIQLQLGQYQPMRFHLRLFPTMSPYGDGGIWTVAAVHMDLQIPNTADHQSISWEQPREILVADMMRTGLLDAAQPLTMVGPITDTPTYRTIPKPIYNGMPESLKQYIHCPPGPSATDVPIPNDGMAVVLHLATAHPIEAGRWETSLTMVYDQVMPKPVCNEGPLDYVLVRGPVDFTRVTTVDRQGRYAYHTRHQGTLTIVPLDVTVSPPQPSGEPYMAEVYGGNQGTLSGTWFSVLSRDQRIAEAVGGTQSISTHLMVKSHGQSDYRVKSVCPNLVF